MGGINEMDIEAKGPTDRQTVGLVGIKLITIKISPTIFQFSLEETI